MIAHPPMAKHTTTLPTSEAFREWAEGAIELLGVPISSLLRDDRDSSRNRASVGLRRTKGIKLDFARDLEIELNQIAKDKGIDIGTWRKKRRASEGDE